MVDFVVIKVYISGNALVILGGPRDLIQTIYHDSADALDAVAIDENSGKIGFCTNEEVYIYRPYGRIEGALKVATSTRPMSQDPDGVYSGPSSAHYRSQRKKAAGLHYHGDRERSCW